MTCFTDKICKSSYLSKKKKKKCKISYLGLVWLKKMVTHHSSLNFRHSSPITHHLKYLNFLFSPIQHMFSASHHSIFSTFCGSHTLAPCQAFLLAYSPHTISSFHITHCSFPFPFSPQYSPKTRDFNPAADIRSSDLQRSPSSPTVAPLMTWCSLDLQQSPKTRHSFYSFFLLFSFNPQYPQQPLRF